MKNPLDACLRKFVVVEANGIRYWGTLVEVGEEEVILRSVNRWIAVPIEKISSIVEKDPALLDMDDAESVEAEDYAPGEVIDGPPADFDRDWKGESPPDEEEPNG